MQTIPLNQIPEPGAVPKRMQAVVIRPERFGEPNVSMQVEEVDVPEIGATDVLVMVMAAGVNFNGVWAAQGKPVDVMKYTGYDFHIGGSDAAGIVWKVGSEVKLWKVGDEVIIHCNQACRQCPACNGLDPLACESQKIWGYETNFGSFAQFTKVQAQQLLPKPSQLNWDEAASYGLTYFTAYRMLVDQAGVTAGDNVLVWGAAGGLGIFGVQLCKLMGANAIAVVSSEEKGKLCMELGAVGYINRKDFHCWRTGNETADEEKERTREMRRFGGKIREFTHGKDVDIVFEHVGKSTFPTSVFVCKKFGKIVIVGATSGFNLDFDVRYLWMRQKTIIGSHFCNYYEAERANRLIDEGKIQPLVSEVFNFEGTAQAHQNMYENRHHGKMVIRVQAPRC